MLATNLFKIKFSYKGENENGAISKKKLQVTAQCINYTDAEALAAKVMENEGMLKYEHDEPEIIKLKTPIYNVLLNDTLTASDTLTNKLAQLYFQGKDDALFIVKAKIFTNIDTGKGNTNEYILPSTSAVSAINYVRKYLIYKGWTSNQFVIISHKIDNTEFIYMEPELIEAKMKVDTELGE